MPRYSITTVVEFWTEVEAETEEEARELAWDYESMSYVGVESIEIDELEDGEEA